MASEGVAPVMVLKDAPPAFEEKGKEFIYQPTDEERAHEEYPTEEELHTLRRVADHIPWRVYTLAFVELCERFSYYGTTVVCKSPRVFESHMSLTDLT